MCQLQYTTEFIRCVKEALKRSHPWSAYHFTNRKGGIPLRKVVSNKISEVAKTTEAYSADTVRSSDVGK